MQLLKVEDPRDSLNRASRIELVTLAKAYGIGEITYHSSLQLGDMVRILRERGITEIKIPDRPLGVQKSVVYDAEKVEVPKQVMKPVEVPSFDKPIDQMSMTDLRTACKTRGIKMARTDNLNTLREKLRGQDAA